MYDLIVIGGGPAGTAAAIIAARARARVLLLERGRFPRHKVCGEFVSAESLSILRDLLGSPSHPRQNAPCHPDADPEQSEGEAEGSMYSVRSRSNDHSSLLTKSLRIPRARVFIDADVLETAIDPPAASIARFDLDNTLWHSAESAGVDARQQVTAHSIEGTGPFHVHTSAGKYESLALVNASGRWSNLTSSALKENTPKWLGLKAHFAEPSPELSVDLYFFENGYCGLQPVSPGRINACAMVRADVASNLNDVLTRHPALQQRSGTWKPLTDPVTTSPLIFRDPQPEKDGMLMVGDAAGFADPFIGDGISLALRSGTLAAECLKSFFLNKVSCAEALHRYCEAYTQSLLPIFRASSTIRRALQFPRTIRRPLLRLLKHTPAVTRYFVTRTRRAS